MPERRMSREGEGGRDRRVIERFHDPKFNQAIKNSLIWIWILFALTLGMCLFEIVDGVLFNPNQVGLSLFKATMFAFGAVIFYGLNASIRLFLRNESIENLIRMAERQLYVTVTITIFAVLSLAIRFVFV